MRSRQQEENVWLQEVPREAGMTVRQEMWMYVLKVSNSDLTLIIKIVDKCGGMIL